MYAKLEIRGKLNLLSGLHIGGNSAFSAIGAVDSSVIKDPVTKQPIIPGSSLKGKMRTLLAREYSIRNGVVSEKPDNDDEKIQRLFGSARKNAAKRSRLIFTDMMPENVQELKNRGILSTEVKFENSINRLTAEANPRQIERAIRGLVYGYSVVYEVENESEVLEDMQLLKEGMKFLEFDYLGGNGSRGYGKISFTDLDVSVAVGKVDDGLLAQCKEIIKGN